VVELDGVQAVGAVRERKRTAGGQLPVIALTARSRQEDCEPCLAAGTDDFLANPIPAAKLWAAMERIMGMPPPADGRVAGALRLSISLTGSAPESESGAHFDSLLSASSRRWPNQPGAAPQVHGRASMASRSGNLAYGTKCVLEP